MAEHLAARALSSVELVRAHLERIDAVDGRVGAFTEVFRQRALEEAQKLDEERARGDVRGPLHGIPFTAKESLEVEGHAATLGLRKRQNERAERDAALLRVAREGGAILLGRTNIPQTLLSYECRNPVYGETCNPFRLSHAPGGSSGGEGAALAAGMSPLGLGTDIGGSIRLPAHMSGVAGFKPTLDRWSNLGLGTILAGQEGVRAQSGAMARTVGDLRFWMRGMNPLRMAALDPRVPPLPFDDAASCAPVAGLRVGVYFDDGMLTPSPAIQRAVQRAADALKLAGVELVPFTPPRCAEAVLDYFSAVAADGGATLQAALRGESVDITMRTLLRVTLLPNAARQALAGAMRFQGEKRVSRMLGAMMRLPVDDYWRLIARLRAYRQSLFDEMSAARLDGLLAPACCVPAVPQRLSADFALAASYTMLYNLVQFPAGVVPVTTVREDETRGRPPAADKLEARAIEVDAASAGMPIGVQVIARPFADERALALMSAIEQDVAADHGFPKTPIDPRAGK